MSFKILPLTLENLDEYKAIRLQALQTDPGVFRRSYKEEAAMPDEFWSQRLTNPKGTIFGLFNDAELIGITAILIEPEGHGYMTHSYILPEYRGQNLSKIFFEKRIEWVQEKGLKRIVVNHRKNNLASKAAILKSGFIYTHSEKIQWPDGSFEEVIYYESILQNNASV